MLHYTRCILILHLNNIIAIDPKKTDIDTCFLEIFPTTGRAAVPELVVELVVLFKPKTNLCTLLSRFFLLLCFSSLHVDVEEMELLDALEVIALRHAMEALEETEEMEEMEDVEVKEAKEVLEDLVVILVV